MVHAHVSSASQQSQYHHGAPPSCLNLPNVLHFLPLLPPLRTSVTVQVALLEGFGQAPNSILFMSRSTAQNSLQLAQAHCGSAANPSDTRSPSASVARD
jgi:hypothetical protein